MIPYPKVIDVLESWSKDTETRLDEIREKSLLDINAVRTGYEVDPHKNSAHGFNQAVNRTILAVKAAAGALMETQMTGCAMEIPKLSYKKLPPFKPTIEKKETEQSWFSSLGQSKKDVKPELSTLTPPKKEPRSFEDECRRSYELHEHELNIVIDSMKRGFHETAKNLKAKNVDGHWDSSNIISKAQDGALAAIDEARKHYCALPANILLLPDVMLEKHLNYFLEILTEIGNNFMMELNAVCTRFSTLY